MKKIILASSSPRRKELLEKINLQFEVEPVDFQEDLNSSLEPHELARKISRDKAKAVAIKYKNAIIIAADTFGVFKGKLLGKPHTETAARQMLSTLSGRTHSVITGFTILDTETGKTVCHSVETRVSFRKLSAAEIESYVKSGEPLDKAGAYAIQGLGAVVVAKINGDYYNVVGLPLSALVENLKEFGVFIL